MYIVSEETKAKMSAAKIGRKYDDSHRFNMRVSQILTKAFQNGYCPIERLLMGRNLGPYQATYGDYTSEEKDLILRRIYERHLEKKCALNPSSLKLLEQYIKGDK